VEIEYQDSAEAREIAARTRAFDDSEINPVEVEHVTRFREDLK